MHFLSLSQPRIRSMAMAMDVCPNAMLALFHIEPLPLPAPSQFPNLEHLQLNHLQLDVGKMRSYLRCANHLKKLEIEQSQLSGEFLQPAIEPDLEIAIELKSAVSSDAAAAEALARSFPKCKVTFNGGGVPAPTATNTPMNR